MAEGEPFGPVLPFGATVGALPHAVIVATPEGVVEYANPAAAATVASPAAETLRGMRLADLRIRFADDRTRLGDALATGVDVDDRLATLTVGTAQRWLRCSLRHVRDLCDSAADPLVVVSLVDVTDDHLRAEQLKWKSHHDYLTGLLNPAGFITAMQEHLSASIERGSRFAVVALSLNSFGLVNESLQEASGDRIVRDVGHRIAAAAPAGSEVGRVASEQFAVLVPLVTGSPAEVDAIVARMARAAGESGELDNNTVQVTMRIGVATSDGEVSTVTALMRNVIIALRRAPIGTAGQHVLFEEEFLLDLKRTQRMEYELRAALRTDPAQLTVAYQPVVRISDGQISGLEALARWTHPNLGCVSPADFIPLAEESDLIGQVGAHVRRTAAGAVAGEADLSGITLAVNVSRPELADASFVARLEEDIERSGLCPERVCIEVTERAFADDYATIGKTIAAFRDRGLSVAMDDFGTGVSSLSQLVALPLSSVKIAAPFVTALGRRRGAQAVLTSIVDIAHASGLAVVAEGVETRHHAEMVAAAGVEYAQGFYYSKPTTVADVASMVTARP